MHTIRMHAEPPIVDVRRVEPGDAAQLADVLRRSFAEFEGKLEPPSGALFETTESLQRTIVTGGAFAIFMQSEPVACVFYRPEAEYLYLFRLGVLPEYRRRGFGKLLIDRVEAQGASRGIPRIRLGTRLALPENIAYYVKLGYVRCEDGVDPRTGKAFYAIMEKKLALQTNCSLNTVSETKGTP